MTTFFLMLAASVLGGLIAAVIIASSVAVGCIWVATR